MIDSFGSGSSPVKSRLGKVVQLESEGRGLQLVMEIHTEGSGSCIFTSRSPLFESRG